jgi:hypothetical protein
VGFGFGDAGEEAFADLGDPPPLGWIGSKEAAPQAAVFVDFPGILACCR